MLHDPDPWPAGERADDDIDLDEKADAAEVDGVDDPGDRSQDPYQPL
jgi:hypothetical protein